MSAAITKEQLQKEIGDILNKADLASMSTKKVREQLEKKFKCDLNTRRGEIKEIVMEIVNSKDSEDDEEEDDEEDDDEEEENEENESEKSSSEGKLEPEPEPKAKAPKRAAAVKKATPKKKTKKNSTDEDGKSAGSDEAGSDAESEEENRPRKAAAKGKKKITRRKKGSDSDSDDDWKQPKKVKKARGAGKGKGTGFTRPYTLSADLASLMGAESLPRHEVVKKMWAMIKERNLYDPKNKQFAICDNDLLKVIGIKRFRTFAMLKYLKPHFLN